MPFLQGQWKFSRTENGVENWEFGSFVKMNIHQTKTLVFDLESKIGSLQITALHSNIADILSLVYRTPCKWTITCMYCKTFRNI